MRSCPNDWCGGSFRRSSLKILIEYNFVVVRWLLVTCGRHATQQYMFYSFLCTRNLLASITSFKHAVSAIFELNWLDQRWSHAKTSWPASACQSRRWLDGPKVILWIRKALKDCLARVPCTFTGLLHHRGGGTTCHKRLIGLNRSRPNQIADPGPKSGPARK